ncbi:MAG: nitroreductase family protein [Austwickia sp.]|nr:nitroreductase family protein [Austwickia sp.]MBK8435160.1 nitroreductase family protein [Austwickia sp.]MBK9101286.1 nitroreductase family protein [Austwickia sp.]
MPDPGPTNRSAPVDVPVHHLIRDRWSPRAFLPDPVDGEDLARLFEAARWAPSSGNSQPWRYLVTYRGEPAHQRLLATLNEGNRRWAGAAPVLVASYAQVTFPAKGDRPARPNPTALHDLGMANALLAIQATALGLHVHFMSGFDQEAVNAAFPPPPDVQPVAVFTVGHGGDPQDLPEDLAARETAPRARHRREAVVVVDGWS